MTATKTNAFIDQTVLTRNQGAVIGCRVEIECPYGVVRYYVFGIGGGAHRIYVRRLHELTDTWTEIN